MSVGRETGHPVSLARLLDDLTELRKKPFSERARRLQEVTEAAGTFLALIDEPAESRKVIHMSTTSSPMAGSGGMAIAAPPGASRPVASAPGGVSGADGELLAACDAFFAADREMKACDADPLVTEAASGAAVARWHAAMEPLARLPARTAAGTLAKAAAGHLAMASLADFEISGEERVAGSALADIVRLAAARDSRDSTELRASTATRGDQARAALDAEVAVPRLANGSMELPCETLTIDHADGGIVTLGRRFHLQDELCDELDNRSLKASGCTKAAALQAWVKADDERARLFEAVFDRRAANLSDAAVLAVHAFQRVQAMRAADQQHMVGTGNLSKYLEEIHWALANLVSETTKAAGLDPAELGFSDLTRSLQETLLTDRSEKA